MEQSLVHVGGYYSTHRAFGDISRGLSFPIGSGLIGRCSAERAPLLLDELSPDTGFLRAEVARQEGLSVALALPLSELGGRPGVLALFFSHSRETRSGGIEVWRQSTPTSKLTLGAAHHGISEDFRRISASFSFALGEGLPGRVTEQQTPELLNQLDHGHEFMRAVAAETSGFVQAIGLPSPASPGTAIVMLGHVNQPVALRLEIWERETNSTFKPTSVQRSTPEATIGLDRIPWLERAERLREPVVFSFADVAEPTVPRGGLILPYFSADKRCVAAVLVW